MKLNIRTHRTELANELRELIERRIYFAHGRFSPRIARASVTSEDINGPRAGEDTNSPRAGVDQHCRIVIKLEHADEMTVEAIDADVKAVTSLAADRASRAVQREWERRRSGRRTSPWRESPSQPDAIEINDEGVEF